MRFFSYQLVASVGQKTHASATPSMTGARDKSFFGLLDAPNKDADNAIVNIGVEARTTWWN
jgi:hypothetical protein